MKIVQFMASRRFGGAEKVFVDVSNELSRRHDVIALVLRQTEYVARFSPRVRVVVLASHPTSRNPFLLLEIYRVIKALRPDIVHTHAVKASVLLHKVGHFLDLRHLGTRHNARKGKIFNKMKWVSAVSREASASVKARRGAVVRTIYNGIEPRRAEGALKAEPFRLAAIGRLDAIKGFDILIEQLRQQSFPFELVIAGDGPERERLAEQIGKNGLRDKVRLIGFHDDIPHLMKTSHVVIISSHSEGFPQVMVESLFYGNVLIATPVGGVTEVLPHLFLAEQHVLGQKLDHVFHNYGHYHHQFNKVKEEKADRFLLGKIAEEYEEYYLAMLNS